MADKFAKMMALANGPSATQPIPEVPKLPTFLKDRFPDKAGEIDAYNEQWVDFMKKTGTIAQ